MNESKMTKLCAFVLGLAVLIQGFGPFQPAQAQQGWESAVRILEGEYVSPRVVTGSSVAGTAFWPATKLRPNSICRVNGAYIVWVGSVSSTLNNQVHTNILQGFPVLSTETITSASLTGNAYFTCDPGVSTCEVRCLDSLRLNP